eukprot:g17739.t2
MGNLLQEFIKDPNEDEEWRLWVWTYYGRLALLGELGVIRVITAVFLRETLEAANNDAELIVQERLRQKAKYVKKLEGIFVAMDESGDGMLTEEEMTPGLSERNEGVRTELLMDHRVQAYLSSMDLDLSEGEALFRLLQNGEGMVTYEDFIDGVMRCKGPAKAIDQICLQCDLNNLTDSVKPLGEARAYLTAALEQNRIIQKRHERKRRKRPHLTEDFVLMGAGVRHSRVSSPFDRVKEDPDHAKPKKVSPRGVNSTEVSAEAVAEEVSVFAEAVAEEVVREDPEEELEEAPDTDTAEPQPEPPSAEVEEESDVLDSDALSELSGLSSEDDLDRLGAPVDAEAVVQAIPVESCSRQAEHALDGAEMCLKVARLAEEAACGTRSWQQLLRCGTHLLDSTHCVTQAASGVARCAVNVPSDLVPLLEKIKTASSGMTRAAVTATRDLMRCTEIISERGLKAAELSNRPGRQLGLRKPSYNTGEDFGVMDVQGEMERRESSVGSVQSDLVQGFGPWECVPPDIEHSRTAMWILKDDEDDDDTALDPYVRSRTAVVFRGAGAHESEPLDEGAERSREEMIIGRRRQRPSRTAMWIEKDLPMTPEPSFEPTGSKGLSRSLEGDGRSGLERFEGSQRVRNHVVSQQDGPAGMRRASAASFLFHEDVQALPVTPPDTEGTALQPKVRLARPPAAAFTAEQWHYGAGAEHSLRAAESSMDLTSLKSLGTVALTGGAASAANVLFGVSVIGLLVFQVARATVGRYIPQKQPELVPSPLLCREEEEAEEEEAAGSPTGSAKGKEEDQA